MSHNTSTLVENRSPGTLLVVDDDSVTRTTLARVLSKAGYEVREAEDGLEAVELCDQQHPDLVLLDVMMPGLDGFETCRRLRQSADYQRLPIVMMTALDDADAVDQAFHAGATDFITKPLNWTLLVQRVRYALRARSMSMELASSREQLAHAQRIARLGHWCMRIDHTTFQFSDQLTEMLQLSAVRLSMDDFLQRIPDEDRGDVQRSLQTAIAEGKPYALDHRIYLSSTDELILHHQGQVERNDDGDVVGLIGTMQDISERKRAEATIEYQALYDQLTGLPNRRLFRDRLIHATQLCDSAKRSIAVMVMGLDRFTQVNESLGYATGDLLLKAMAQRLGEETAASTTVARLENDVFGILLEDLSGPGELERIADKLHHRLSGIYRLDGQEIYATVSIGVALRNAGSAMEGDLVQAADTAMHRAKDQGGNECRYFHTDMNQRTRQRLDTGKGLRLALERDEFELFYKPQIHCQTGAVVGTEALLRWNRPGHGVVPPDEFIPIAEETGLILPVGQWVLETACTQLRGWREAGMKSLRMGVNFSAKQFTQADLVPLIEGALLHNEIDPRYLDVEITESIALADFDATVRTLNELRELGLSASIDDFGTGFCSLGYLHRLPVSTLKIDRTFVKDIRENGENGAIAKAIIAMAHNLNLSVIAEGVEQKPQFDFFKRNECDEVQGYLTGRPMAAHAFSEFMRTQIETA